MLSPVLTMQIAIAGAAVGCLGAIGIYWAPVEPYKHWIVAAGTLRGIVTALLMTVFVQGSNSIGAALLAGGLCGLATAAIVFLAKGGWSSKDAPYVLPTGLAQGLVLGITVRWLLS